MDTTLTEDQKNVLDNSVEAAKALDHDTLARLFVSTREAFILLAPYEYGMFRETFKGVLEEKNAT